MPYHYALEELAVAPEAVLLVAGSPNDLSVRERPDQVASAYPQVRSVLVVRHGSLVYEHYWHGLDKTDGHDVRSVTKSFIGALAGIALAEGKIKSLDQTVGELLSPHLPKDADPRLARVTLKQLLTMTSGLSGDDASLDGHCHVVESRLGPAHTQPAAADRAG